ncbi:Quercetin 2,3-dioxygenase [Poriferisphaera corsica]|uniref:Quercetin 2,3-dioxygenase n=1 Tax=Poriferisphaera corsica TaxID=2528020 RepID=A0A517YSS4_9BACT|nr:pirin-like bicupin family protein [Poriferisphaera corsica]QDU33202.1 Quercetin 2,3-dioxygenase [Poriferisphaera corsica]
MKDLTAQLDIRRAGTRGITQIDWLQSHHAFSFGHYQNAKRNNFRALRVLNEDIVSPDQGFGEHPHANMEIISWVLQGQLEHADSTHQHHIIAPGDLQIMTAGQGIRHSEFNPSKTDPAHFLQIWVTPNKLNLTPAYQQKHFSQESRQDHWLPLITTTPSSDTLTINQDLNLYITDLTPGHSIPLINQPSRHTYLHINTGSITLTPSPPHPSSSSSTSVAAPNFITLSAGDALALSTPTQFTLTSTAPNTQLLHFDLD